MALAHIPFVHGALEGVDPKLIPQGWFNTALNVRFRKDGRLGSRYGVAKRSGFPAIAGSPVTIASGSFGPKHAVIITQRVNETSPPQWFDLRDDGLYTDPTTVGIGVSSANNVGYGSAVGSLGVPKRHSVAANLKYQCAASDCAYISPYIAYVTDDEDIVTALSANRSVQIQIYEASSNKLIRRVQIAGTADACPKVVAIGTVFLVLYNDADTIKFFAFDTSNFSSTTGSTATANAGTGSFFDLAPYDSTKALLSFQSGAAVLEWGTVTNAGVYTQKATQVIANPAKSSITTRPTPGDVAVVWNEGATFNQGNCHYGVWTIAGAVVVAKTTLDSSGHVAGYPVSAPCLGSSGSFCLIFNTNKDAAGAPNQVNIFVGSSGSTVRSLAGLAVCSKPFSGPNTATFAWMVNHVETHGGALGGFATYKLMDCTGLGLTGISGGQMAICEAVCAQHNAMAGNYLLGTKLSVDPRRHTIAPTATSTLPSMTAFLTLLPVANAKGFGADAVRIENGTFAERLYPVNANGQLVFSGPRVREFDGSQFFESGLADGPEEVQLANAGGAGMGAGTYQYIVIWEWFDLAGRRHRSPPSVPVSITLGAPASVTVSIQRPSFSSRLGGLGNVIGIYANIYRTKNNGIVFYLVNSAENLFTLPQNLTYMTYTDTSSDATIGTHETLYTQGERGGLSGLLPHDEPPPCRYMWAGNDRIIMGGLEDSSAVQWSKLFFPGEPIEYADNDAYRLHVDGDVTAVACLDGIWLVATRDHWFSISGEGPDDNGAGGFFSEPRKLPGDVGCISHRSVIEVPDGLLFQGRSDKLYLLPRGGGAPQLVGQGVRDSMAAYPLVVGATMLPDENTVVLTCFNTAATDGILVIYDTRIREWSVDNLFTGASSSTRVMRTACTYDGKLLLDGKFLESSSYVDDETGAQSRAIFVFLETGDVRPFGVAGQGRLKKATLLSEYRAGNASLTLAIEASRDGFLTTDYTATWTVNGQAAGSLFEREYRLKYIRDSAYRFRFTVTGAAVEGLVFNGLTLEAFPAEGSKLLSAAQRA